MFNIRFSFILLLILFFAPHAHSQDANRILSLPSEHTTQNIPPSPIFEVTSLESLVFSYEPRKIAVRAKGLIPTSGWRNPTLIPLSSPPDGPVLDLIFAAHPTANAGDASFTEVETIFIFDDLAANISVIRVRAHINALELESVSGSIQLEKTHGFDINSLIGKRIQTAPDTLTSMGVRLEDLPVEHRILRHRDGLPSLAFSPLRLTITLDQFDTITDVMWR